MFFESVACYTKRSSCSNKTVSSRNSNCRMFWCWHYGQLLIHLDDLERAQPTKKNLIFVLATVFISPGSLSGRSSKDVRLRQTTLCCWFTTTIRNRCFKSLEWGSSGSMGEDRLTFSLGGTVHCTVSAKPLCQRKDRVTTEKKLFYSLPTDQCYIKKKLSFMRTCGAIIHHPSFTFLLEWTWHHMSRCAGLEQLETRTDSYYKLMISSINIITCEWFHRPN